MKLEYYSKAAKQSRTMINKFDERNVGYTENGDAPHLRTCISFVVRNLENLNFVLPLDFTQNYNVLLDLWQFKI